ncbi:cohesin domain-containing protein [Eubacterium sp.]|uniref:cohesin domain-containing protein n=1 Tax=Eubacterium sp. TaxID=142586 RepID=UPI00351FBE53
MRKLRWILLIVFTLLCIAISPGVAYAKSDLSLVAASVTIERNKASVNIDLKGNTGIWALKFKVGYDHSALKLTSAQNGKVFSDNDVTMPDSLDKDEFVFLASSNSLKNIETSDTVLTLNFKTVDYALEGKYPIKLTLVQAIDVEGNVVNMGTNDGAVIVFYDTKKDDIVFDKSKNQGIKIPLDFRKKAQIKKIQINKKKIKKDDYTVDTDGNVVISPNYLNNLKDGKYSITVKTKKRKIKKDFFVKTDGDRKVKEESDTEKDNKSNKEATGGLIGQKTGILIGALIIVVILIGGIVRVLIKKRRE